MQAPYVDYTYQDEQVAKNNLQKIIDDPYGIGDTNAGWCYLLAPLRTFLTDPRFISLIRQYKQKYNREINAEFLRAMYGTNNLQELYDKGIKTQYNYDEYNFRDVYETLKAICELTDDKGEMKYQLHQSYSFYKGIKTHTVRSPYIGFIKLSHKLRPDGVYRDVSMMSNILAECTAIMSESDDVLALNNNQYEKNNIIIIGQKTYFDNNGNPKKSNTILDNYHEIDLREVERKLNEGACITANSYGNHFFNIYKKNGYYYITGGGQINNNRKLKKFSSLKEALITVWMEPIQESHLSFFNIKNPLTNNNSITEYFAFQCFVNQKKKINQIIGLVDGDYKQWRIQQYNRQRNQFFVNQESKINRIGIIDRDYKQRRIQEYNIQKQNNKLQSYYKQQMKNTIDDYDSWLLYYNNEIRNLQKRLKYNEISLQQEMDRKYNLFNNYDKYNYYNPYNNFNFYNKQQEQKRIQLEMDILNRNIQYLKKQIEIVNMRKKNSLRQKKDRMSEILKNSNYDDEVYNLYDNFMQKHLIIKNYSNYNKDVNNLYFMQKKKNTIK